jgi:hypothetical protein
VVFLVFDHPQQKISTPSQVSLPQFITNTLLAGTFLDGTDLLKGAFFEPSHLWDYWTEGQHARHRLIGQSAPRAPVHAVTTWSRAPKACSGRRGPLPPSKPCRIATAPCPQHCPSSPASACPLWAPPPPLFPLRRARRPRMPVAVVALPLSSSSP